MYRKFQTCLLLQRRVEPLTNYLITRTATIVERFVMLADNRDIPRHIPGAPRMLPISLSKNNERPHNTNDDKDAENYGNAENYDDEDAENYDDEDAEHYDDKDADAYDDPEAGDHDDADACKLMMQ